MREKFAGRQQRPTDAQGTEPRSHEPKGVRSDLRRQGVDEGFANVLLPRLEELRTALAPEAYAAVLAGVSLAYGAHRHQRAQLDEGPETVAEMHNLMLSFVGELQKLDEALATLTVFLERMRVKAVRDPSEPVH